MNRSERIRADLVHDLPYFEGHSTNQRAIKKIVNLMQRNEPSKKQLRSERRKIRLAELQESAHREKVNRITERVKKSLGGDFERVDTVVLNAEIRYLIRNGVTFPDMVQDQDLSPSISS